MDELSITPSQGETVTKKSSSLNLEKIKESLAEQNGELQFSLFTIYKYINRKQFTEALKIGKYALNKYLHGIYHTYYHVNYVVTSNDIQAFLHSMVQLDDLPFTEIEVTKFLQFCDSISLTSEDKEQISQELYEKYRNLFDKLQTFIWD